MSTSGGPDLDRDTQFPIFAKVYFKVRLEAGSILREKRSDKINRMWNC
jgi:hypothetical protein